MKKIICLLCSLFLLMSVSITVFAEETVLTAEVPNAHTVTVTSEGGRVALDGTVCKGAAEVERHEEQSYRIIPDAGKLIDKVLYNGEDVTAQLEKGVFTAPKLVRDAEIEVVYKNAPSAPDSKKYGIGGKVEDTDGKAVSGVTIDIGNQGAVTDENGRFQLKDIPSGIHMIAITGEDGKVIGSGQITIEKADPDDLTLTADKDGNPVIHPQSDTKDIDLTLVVGEDGSITVKAAEDVTPEPRQPGSQTGDNSSLWLWLGLLTTSAGVVFIILLTNRRKKKAVE